MLPQPRSLRSRGLQRHHLRPGGKSTGESCVHALLTSFLCCLLSTEFFMLYRRWACKEASSVPLRSRCCVPWPPGPPPPTIGGVGLQIDNRRGGRPPGGSRHLIEGWLSCSLPLTSLPPHVSRPGWYPAPLGSYSRQLRHKLKHGMDTEELTSHENKRFCTEPAGQDESQARAQPRRAHTYLAVFQMSHLGNTPGG